VTRARRSVASTASKRPARRRSTRSADAPESTIRFGTDGIRGDAERDLTPELITALGRAAARVVGTSRPFVVGRDTRRSGLRIETDLAAGLNGAGADVLRAGVIPTPAVAWLAQARDAPAAVVSASHNAYTDNGVKLFAPGGHKIPDAWQDAIERDLAEPAPALPAGRGWADDLPDAPSEYVAHLTGALDDRRLDGLAVVVDCANGAASGTAPAALRALGAAVTVIAAEPDGTNINDGCGSTYPQRLQAAVRQHGADAGLALDGDADRVIAVDEHGELVDGDRILALLALDRHERGALPGDAVVATAMSNLGLRRALAAHGIDLVETPVGDRHVLVELVDRGLVLGGEQSGHIIVTDLATTGDGTLTGILVLDVVARRGRRLSELAAVMQPLPQVLRNVAVADPTALESPRVQDAVAAAERDLGDDGRVLVRASGTEPVVRIMVEATTTDRAQAIADRIASAL
jgi:phosphoglucosamine mutase